MKGVFFLAEAPVLRVSFSVECQMLSSVSGSSVVAKPHIITLTCKNKGRGELDIIGSPKVHVAFHAVLE